MTDVIPAHVLAPPPVSLPAYKTLKNNVSAPSEQQITLAAANAPLRYGYGEMRFGPLVANVLVDAAGSLLVDCVLGEGTNAAIVAGEINDAAAPAGVTVTFYDGTQVVPDPALVAAWLLQGVTYADVRPGVSYAVLKIPKTVDLQIDERSITFQARLLKIFDPRTLFKQVQSDINTGWVDFGTAPGYTPNGRLARDGTMTADVLTDLDGSATTSGGRKWTSTVPNDSLTRTISISINKDPLAVHQAGVGLAYTGGGTPLSHVIQVNLATGATTLFSGSGATITVIDRLTHWEVVMSMANNSTGNTSFVLSLYPAL